MVKVSSCPPQEWRLAVEEEVHPGCDDLVQVPTVKTTGGSTSCTSLCFSLQKAKFQELYLSNVIQCGGEMLVLVFMLCGD